MRLRGMSSRGWLMLIAIGVLAGTMPANAAEPATPQPGSWTRLQSLDNAGKRSGPENEMSGDGTSVIWWSDRRAETCADRWASVRRPSEDAWSEPVLLGDRSADYEMAVGGRNSIVAVLESCTGDLTYRRLLDDGWGPARPVSTDGAGTLERVDVSGRGTLLVTYVSGGELKGVLHPLHGKPRALPPVQLGTGDFGVRVNVDSEEHVTYVIPRQDASQRDYESIALWTYDGDSWRTERILPPAGAEPFSGLMVSSDGRGSISIAAVTQNDSGGRAELWSWVRARGQAELGEPTRLGDPTYEVIGVSGGFDRSGRLVLAWAEDTGEDYEYTPFMTTRGRRTGEVSAPRPVGPPGRQAFPYTDVAADGTVVIRVGLANDGVVYVCDGIRRCSQVGSPILPPLDTSVFEAGPNRSASAAFSNYQCHEEGGCWKVDIRASYLAPRGGR